MNEKDKAGKRENGKSVGARRHSEYADDGRQPEAEPEETGDYCDPVKDLTGRGNASKGPWKQQGGAGHGENYGARDDRAKPDRKK